MTLPRRHTWNCLYFGNDADCAECHPQPTCKNCGHTASQHSYRDQPATFGWCPGCRGCGPSEEETTMGIGRKKGQPDRSDTSSTGSVNYISCPGGCGTRVAENDGLCANCRTKVTGTYYGTAGTGSDSCAKPLHPENEGEDR